MGDEDEKVLVQTRLRRELVEKVDFLAERMGMSRATFVAELLGWAVESEELFVKFITHKYVQPVAGIFKRWRKGEGVEQMKKKRGRKKRRKE